MKPESLADVKDAFERYKMEVSASKLQPGVKYDYIGYVDRFLRWLNDDFVPGARVR